MQHARHHVAPERVRAEREAVEGGQHEGAPDEPPRRLRVEERRRNRGRDHDQQHDEPDRGAAIAQEAAEERRRAPPGQPATSMRGSTKR